ncbi:hypothetical protein [Lacisediminimonas sp.]|uniref:hypothetical protein n=1 Tax=Lacisediminimonas sp. TaxID=3060582 RepID=UPI0027202797|nr:hypothetical protein [Lacisediminimonas sp.]MDO8299590.1 hypothetical protein [Lacisediminimonas sp.]
MDEPPAAPEPLAGSLLLPDGEPDAPEEPEGIALELPGAVSLAPAGDELEEPDEPDEPEVPEGAVDGIVLLPEGVAEPDDVPEELLPGAASLDPDDGVLGAVLGAALGVSGVVALGVDGLGNVLLEVAPDVLPGVPEAPLVSDCFLQPASSATRMLAATRVLEVRVSGFIIESFPSGWLTRVCRACSCSLRQSIGTATATQIPCHDFNPALRLPFVHDGMTGAQRTRKRQQRKYFNVPHRLTKA